MAPPNEKQQAHQLPISSMPSARRRRASAPGDDRPLSRSLASAPLEEEEITSETAVAIDRARASLARGEGTPHEDILREFCLGK